MDALLIIDMQKICFKPETPRYDTNGVVSRINKVAQFFRSNNTPVVFIQHDGSSQGICIPSTTEWEFVDRLEVFPADHIISKTANDAFYCSDLEKFLLKEGIDRLYVTGCATDYCVNATLQNGLTRDFNIVVLSDCHTTANRPGINAETLIEYYNWLWQDMIPTKGTVEVRSSADILTTMSLKNN